MAKVCSSCTVSQFKLKCEKHTPAFMRLSGGSWKVVDTSSLTKWSKNCLFHTCILSEIKSDATKSWGKWRPITQILSKPSELVWPCWMANRKLKVDKRIAYWGQSPSWYSPKAQLTLSFWCKVVVPSNLVARLSGAATQKVNRQEWSE